MFLATQKRVAEAHGVRERVYGDYWELVVEYSSCLSLLRIPFTAPCISEMSAQFLHQLKAHEQQPSPCGNGG